MTVRINPPKWFWLVSILALIWNILGVIAYLSQVYASPEAIEALPQIERDLLDSSPSWVTAAFAIAVWAGTLGCILLLLRKVMAHFVLVISLIGVVVQMSWVFFVSNSLEVYGPGQSVMPIFVLIVGLLLILFARKGKAKSWFN